MTIKFDIYAWSCCFYKFNEFFRVEVIQRSGDFLHLEGVALLVVEQSKIHEELDYWGL